MRTEPQRQKPTPWLVLYILLGLALLLALVLPDIALAEDGSAASASAILLEPATLLALAMSFFQLVMSLVTGGFLAYHHRLLARNDRQSSELTELQKRRTETLEEQVRDLQLDRVTRAELDALRVRMDGLAETVTKTASQVTAIQADVAAQRSDLGEVLKILRGGASRAGR